MYELMLYGVWLLAFISFSLLFDKVHGRAAAGWFKYDRSFRQQCKLGWGAAVQGGLGCCKHFVCVVVAVAYCC